MKLFLKKGEYKWSEEGTHVCDERGFAIVCEEDCEVEIPNEEKFTHAQKTVSEDRAIRGVFVSAPVFSAPQAVPEQAEAPAEPEPISASSSDQPAPEEPPAQPAPEESPQAHAEPEPQAHGQETSEAPETQPAAEQSAESQTAPE